ncbi:MAG: NAD+ synthase [Omnitrophica WOR_2 bacterium GWA2_47_8]|nr:MAG: NAD+ synthase [Omnitrophica WOR_2 bacterium GWA2_47_8]
MLRLALAQINTTVGDLDGNFAKIVQAIKKAQTLSVDLLVFPELAVTGYPPEDLLLKRHFIDDNLKILKRIVPHTRNITVMVGFVDRDKQGNIFNAAAVIYNKKLKGIYHKQELPNYGVFDEKRYFGQTTVKNIFQFNKALLGVSICEDIWKPQGPCLEQIKAGANILINLSSSPYHFQKEKLREKILKQWAKKYGVYVLYCNVVGGQDELVFDGGSLLVDPKGKCLAQAKQFEEDFVVVDIPKEFKRVKPKTNGYKKIVIAAQKSPDSRLPIKGIVAKTYEPAEEIYRALVLGTRDYITKNGFKKVVIGLSGGVDSAVVAAIAVEAIGKENVIGVTMPSRFTSSGTHTDAKGLARNLGIRLIEISLEDVFKAYLTSLEKEFSGTAFNVAEENLQARIRGNILMAFSNKFGWLVLTTGNKSEIAVGYCTLYGDMSGGFAVIKDVPKTKVYEIARFINKKARNVIPESILTRAPTAELRANQTDQDSLPPYDELDSILSDYVEEHKSFVQIGQKNKNTETIKRVIKMVDYSEYKRRQAPPGVKITTRAFGKDWRLPITNKYKEF